MLLSKYHYRKLLTLPSRRKGSIDGPIVKANIEFADIPVNGQALVNAVDTQGFDTNFFQNGIFGIIGLGLTSGSFIAANVGNGGDTVLGNMYVASYSPLHFNLLRDSQHYSFLQVSPKTLQSRTSSLLICNEAEIWVARLKERLVLVSNADSPPIALTIVDYASLNSLGTVEQKYSSVLSTAALPLIPPNSTSGPTIWSVAVDGIQVSGVPIKFPKSTVSTAPASMNGSAHTRPRHPKFRFYRQIGCTPRHWNDLHVISHRGCQCNLWFYPWSC